MKYEHSHWGWMLAADFYLGGMGGGMLVMLAVAEFLTGMSSAAYVIAFAAAVLISLGAILLILELGRPLHAWRVFLNPRAVLTIGAWMMFLAIAFGVAYASFGLAAVPWSQWSPLRSIIAIGCLVFGLGVASYTGLFLGKMRARTFWSGSGLSAILLLSALATGGAAYGLLTSPFTPVEARTLSPLVLIILTLLIPQLILWPVHVLVKVTSATVHESTAASRWLRGDRGPTFWGGVVGVGVILPLGLYLVSPGLPTLLAHAAVLIGGLVMRRLVIASDDRIWLPGEEAFAASLPKSEDPIFHTWS